MTPIEYQCDKEITIRLCPPFISCIGDKPAYWYLKRDLHPWEPGMRETWRAGYHTLYWTGDSWQYHTPKQFPTAEAAFEEFTNTINK